MKWPITEPDWTQVELPRNIWLERWPDIERWLLVNIGLGYAGPTIGALDDSFTEDDCMWSAQSSIGRLQVTFRKQEDAILFTLRWR